MADITIVSHTSDINTCRDELRLQRYLKMEEILSKLESGMLLDLIQSCTFNRFRIVLERHVLQYTMI